MPIPTPPRTPASPGACLDGFSIAAADRTSAANVNEDSADSPELPVTRDSCASEATRSARSVNDAQPARTDACVSLNIDAIAASSWRKPGRRS